MDPPTVPANQSADTIVTCNLTNEACVVIVSVSDDGFASGGTDPFGCTGQDDNANAVVPVFCQPPVCSVAADCDDGNECTTDVCHLPGRYCTNDPLANGTSCEFGGVDGVCDAGACRERSWGTPVLIGTGGSAQVAVDPSGSVTAVWNGPGGIWSNRYPVDGLLQNPDDLLFRVSLPFHL
jgi:hypothetical protein